MVMRISPSSRLVLISLVVAATLLSVAARDVPADPGQTAFIASPSPGPTISAAPSVAPAPTAAAATQGPSSADPTPDATTEPSPTRTAAGSKSLAGLLASLSVADEHRYGYERDLFRLWIDADGNGCNTRQEVLIAEAVTPPQIGSGCRLSGGRWVSSYDGIKVTDASKLDVDHLVPLAEAWDSGAWSWTAEQRETYANDLSVPWALIAVTAGSNRSKGDRDPAEWVPPLASGTCTYIVDWVAVKARWNLTVDTAEQQTLGDLALACSRTPIPSIPPKPESYDSP